ncbi:hypothetical protein KKK_04965 [Pseudomonas putida B6-2]|nr:hypothetical protein KKK_04965 [Pseudomonas putida B6-2]
MHFAPLAKRAEVVRRIKAHEIRAICTVAVAKEVQFREAITTLPGVSQDMLNVAVPISAVGQTLNAVTM